MLRSAVRSPLALFLFALATLHAQAPEEKPLPDIPTLMRQVETNQRKSEAVERDYVFRQSNQFDVLDKHDGIKKTRRREFEIFWINGVQVQRKLSEDGKPLSPDEQKKEDARIDDIVRKARERRDKADAQGKETDSHGNEEITVSRILELGAFSNPRRQLIDNRPTIIVDFLGDPKAKTRNAAENAFKELAGTLWIDEQDASIQHLEGHFDHDFKVLGGLAVDVKQGTWFKATFARINNEVWLPQSLEADGHARYLLFFTLNGHVQSHSSDYRKFKATSTLLPNFTPIPAPDPQPAPTTPQPPPN